MILFLYKIQRKTIDIIFLSVNLQNHLPFAVVGSRDEVLMGGEKFRARQYPWGTVLGEYTFYISIS